MTADHLLITALMLLERAPEVTSDIADAHSLVQAAWMAMRGEPISQQAQELSSWHAAHAVISVTSAK